MKKFFITLMCIVMVVCFMPTVAMADTESESGSGTKDDPFTTVEAYNNAIKDEAGWNQKDVYLQIEQKYFNNSSDKFELKDVESWTNTPYLHLTIKNCSFTGNTSGLNENYSCFMYLTNCKELVIDKCTFDTGESALKYGINWNLMNVEESKVSITNCTFKGTYGKNAVKLTQRGNEDDKAIQGKHSSIESAEISGCTFSGNNAILGLGTQAKKEDESAYSSTGAFPITITGNKTNVIVREDYTLEKDATDVTVSVVPAGKEVTKETKTQIKGQPSVTDAVGVKDAESLQAAISAAKDGDTVTLLGDVNVTSAIGINKSLIIDLGGHKVERSPGSTGEYFAMDKESVVFSASEGALVLKNGEIVGRINVYDSSSVELAKDLTINGFVCVWGEGTFGQTGCKTPTLNVYGKITNPSYFCIATNGTDKSAPIINIYDGAVIAADKSTAIYAPSNGKVVVSGGTISGTTGIEIRAGELTVNSGTICGNGSPTATTPNGSGTTTYGAGIAIAQHTTKLPINVTINGGNISGYYALYESNPQGNAEGDIAKITLNVKGGNFAAINNGTVAVHSQNKEAFISGGTFTPAVNNEYLAPGVVQDSKGNVYTPYYGGSTPTDSLKTARTEATKAVADYVNPADYEEAQQAEIKTIVDNAKKDIEAAKTADEIKAIEAAAKAELDKLETAEEMALIRTIEGTQFTARSKATTLNGKKAIRVTWNKPADIEFDGYEIYRSTERYKGYGTEPFFTTTNQKYTNNKGLKVGKTYYYRVRGFKYVNDEKVYTEYSLKAWRTVK